MSRLVLGGFLLLAWILLWGDLSAANVLGGTLVIAALFLVFPSTRPVLPRTLVHPGALARLIGHVLGQVLVSNLLLAREILSRHGRIQSQIIEVPMRTSSRTLLTLITNITALTPGTMPVDVRDDPPVVTIHVLVLRDAQAPVREMHRLEELCVRAFATREGIEEFEQGHDRLTAEGAP